MVVARLMAQGAIDVRVVIGTKYAHELPVLEPQRPLVGGKSEIQVLIGLNMPHILLHDVTAQDGIFHIGVPQVLGIVEHQHAIVDVGQRVAQLVQTDGGTQSLSFLLQQKPHLVAKVEEERLGLACPVAVDLHFAIGDVISPAHGIDAFDDTFGKRIKWGSTFQGIDGDEYYGYYFDVAKVLDGILKYSGGNRNRLFSFPIVQVPVKSLPPTASMWS